MENRVIKFRAYIIDEKRMVDVSSVGRNKGYGGAYEIFVEEPGFDPYAEIIEKKRPPHRKSPIGIETFCDKVTPFHLMQFTGLLDKNENEIFEGDIVRYVIPKQTPETVDIEYTELVHFSEGSFDVDGCPLNVVNHLCEVIGNIYKNPELLNP